MLSVRLLLCVTVLVLSCVQYGDAWFHSWRWRRHSVSADVSLRFVSAISLLNSDRVRYLVSYLLVLIRIGKLLNMVNDHTLRCNPRKILALCTLSVICSDSREVYSWLRANESVTCLFGYKPLLSKQHHDVHLVVLYCWIQYISCQ